MGSLDGKVAVISGAARGQGRSHAVKMAEEGADIIAIDLCGEVESTLYPLATADDLASTAAAVEATGRRVIARRADVRDAEQMNSAVADGVEELGRLDIVVANAGIVSYHAAPELPQTAWAEMIDTNLTGAWNLTRPALRPMIDGGEGGAVILVSSIAAHSGRAHVPHYSAAKAGLVGLMQSLATELGPQMIRVNTIHPTCVDTPMIQNAETYRLMAGDVPTEVDPENVDPAVAEALISLNKMPVMWVDTIDITNAVLYLAAETGRFVTGTQLRVDAGSGL